MRKCDNAQLLVSANLIDDHAAMRRARLLAGDGDLVEVWRDTTCIYSIIRECVR